MIGEGAQREVGERDRAGFTDIETSTGRWDYGNTKGSCLKSMHLLEKQISQAGSLQNS